MPRRRDHEVAKPAATCDSVVLLPRRRCLGAGQVVYLSVRNGAAEMVIIDPYIANVTCSQRWRPYSGPPVGRP